MPATKPKVNFADLSKQMAQARAKVDAEVTEIRDEIYQLRTDRRNAERAPLSVDDALASFDKHVEWVRREKNPLQWFTHANFNSRSLRDTLTLGTLPPTALDVFAMVAPDVLRKSVKIQFEAMLKSEDTLSHIEREALIKKTDARLLELEKREEGLIAEAEQHGMIIDRRPDRDPRLYLGLV